MSHLVAEDLDLRVRPVQRLVAAVVVTVRVDLDHQRETFDPLLGGEVRAQAVDGDEDLRGGRRVINASGRTFSLLWSNFSRSEDQTYKSLNDMETLHLLDFYF